MARNNQKLINYHTGKKAEMPSGSSVDYGEIVVRHNAESPELLIKIGEDSFGVFQASGAVKTAIDSAVSTAKSELNTDISNLETKISDLSGVTKDFSAATVATYATKTELSDAQTAITNAYTDAISDAKKAVYDSATTFATKAKDDAIAAAAASAITLSGLIDGVDDRVDTVSGNLNTFKTEVKNTYATKEELKSTSGSIISDYTTAIGDAKDKVYTSATTFATSAVTVAKGELNSAINDVASNVETLSGAVSSITENYVTNGTLNTTVKTLEGKISSAKTEAIGEASGYTDTQIAAAKEYSDGKLSAATDSLKQTIKTLDEKVDTLSGNVETAIDNLESTLTETINNKVAVAYRYQGTVTNYADLPTSNMSSGTVGYVYNVEKANGNYPAGTNYAWNGTEWDALGGSVDLSPYALKTEVSASAETLNNKIETVSGKVDTVSTSLETFKTTVANTYATKTELEATSGSIITAYTNAIAAAKKEATDASSAYTDTQIAAAYSSAITAAAASAETLNTSIEAVDNKVTGLSASTINIETTANSAIQNASIVDKDTCKVSVGKKGTELQFDFRNLVVDCGEF